MERYLAIGNSLTLHGKLEYWWNEVGMAASREGKDYYSLVCDALRREYGLESAERFNFAEWERSSDRSSLLCKLRPFIEKKPTIVSIQLGENVTDMTNYEGDLKELLGYLRSSLPGVKIIVVGDFWDMGKRNHARWEAAAAAGVLFASLEDIAGKKEYQSAMGAKVFGDDGSEHIIAHEGVAAHPGDKGMQAIADRIMREIRK